jgi:hypothetical protein
MTPDGILMVRPLHFGFNPETAASNAFQQQTIINDAQQLALAEFDEMVKLLQNRGVEIIVAPDQPEVICPDAVFPNNWFCVMPDGKYILFPMMAESRRKEINPEVKSILSQKINLKETIDLSVKTADNQFLEGTGSIVFDHQFKLAYACESPRTNLKLLEELCRKIGYRAITFLATDATGKAIYHTNVLMAVGEKVVILCSESVEDLLERAMLKESIRQTGKTLLDICFSQMNSFAGNAFEVKSKNGNLWILSITAWDVLSADQKLLLGGEESVCAVSIPTIEKLGGGSARCMMAGWFLKDNG